MKRRFAAAGMAAASIAGLIGFAPSASAATPACVKSAKVLVGGYGAWVPVSDGGSVNCVMGQGTHNEGVGDLQSALRKCNGANGLDVDGRYGPLTAQAVRDFQALVRIPVDGVYGPQTRAAMYWVINDTQTCTKY
ncbi:peptidoglycan-binding domain-containing protein [Streptomyces sp. NPDC046866]|uniref:peptidoglycan-binding domain-containing protein n=1 Tax=Streptomyces sp. NPDC046866 TaxID=3154921 RepID=UPI0034543500